MVEAMYCIWPHAGVVVIQCPVSRLATTITQVCNSVTLLYSVDISIMRDIQTAGRILVLTAAAQFADNIIHCMTDHCK